MITTIYYKLRSRKYLCKCKRKLYVAFVDFRKAFDCVDCRKLYKSLVRGVKGKMFYAIEATYATVTSRIRNGHEFSYLINCPYGLRQRYNLSPILFSFFINELLYYFEQHGVREVHISPVIVEILMLLFADDVAPISDTVVYLQNQLNLLYGLCEC